MSQLFHNLINAVASIVGPCLLLILAVPAISAQSSPAQVVSSIESGIRQKVFPGAVVVIGRADTILYAAGFGQYAWRGDSRRPDPDWSLWDLASLTKVVATASAVAVLVDRGKLDLDASVSSTLKEFTGPAKDHVTIKMLLNHTSGLPAWVPLRSDPQTPAGARSKLFETELSREPGSVAVYSDLNAMLAGIIVERVTKVPLDQFTASAVFAPTGMTDAQWRPAPIDRLRSVPGELRSDGSPLMGRVHDPNAQLLGGVAGHAGLFATGIDLARFTQHWMRGIKGEDSSWVSPATLRKFLEQNDSSGTRALGWDTPLPATEIADGGPSLYGYCATPTTYGHTGYTGTMIWFDIENDAFVVLLTNRSYQPIRDSFEAIRQVRAAVSDAARRMLGQHCSAH